MRTLITIAFYLALLKLYFVLGLPIIMPLGMWTTQRVLGSS